MNPEPLSISQRPGAASELVRLGTLGHPERAEADATGGVTPWPGGWSLDWWVGADDRWHLPRQEAAVRSQLLGGAPVMETAMRVPGGDAVHRTFAVSAGAMSWLVVEVDNRTPVPFAVAFALKPPPPAAGNPGLYEIEVGERFVVANGSVALALPRPANRVAAIPGSGPDLTELVTAGDAVEGTVVAVCPDGQASAAVIYPLPHTARIRLAVPMRRVPPSKVAGFPTLPEADEVVKGWARHLAEGPRFGLPDTQLADKVTVSRAQRLLDPDEAPVGPDAYDSVRNMLVRESESGLVLAEGIPRSWFGSGWEVHDLPTVFGTFGYAVRWHGRRPALLWELRTGPGAGPVTVTAPSLDPGWSSTSPTGETLLAGPVPDPPDRETSPVREPEEGTGGEASSGRT